MEIGFDEPWFLLLFGVLPVLWIFSFRSLAGLGPWRRIFALLLRSAVLSMFVLALAEVQLKRISEKVTVVFAVDLSDSVPRETREAAFEYVKQAVAAYRDQDREDLAGVVVFGGLAKVDHQPIDEDIVAIGGTGVEWSDATNIADALKVAHALFTDEAAKRIVVVSDGNENIGDAHSVAQMLADEGIGIDVVPVILTARAEVAVEKISLPVDLRQGQVFESRVVINNFADPDSKDPNDYVTGTLTVTEHTPSGDRVLAEKEVTLEPGKNVFTVPHSIDRTGMSTFHARFTPADPQQDRVNQNNQATAFTRVRGRGHILFIEDGAPEFKGEFDSLVRRLEQQDLEVTVMDTTRLFDTAADLLEFDAVVLANVPRSSGDPQQGIVHFSDEQISALVRNTEQMGCGLVMIGGPNSFGAGGWTNTELEKAMPVDFQIHNDEVRAVGALVLMMHASEMAEGNHWQKVVAQEAIKMLGPADYCGLIHWDINGDTWLWTQNNNGIANVGAMRNTMLTRLDKMFPGDMPEFGPAMEMALADFQKLDENKNIRPSTKHMIIISDGDPVPPTTALLRQFKDNDIQISTVAIQAHDQLGHQTLQQIANVTGGKYYKVTNAKALPKIYQREVRRLAKPLLYEPTGGVQPIVVGWNQILEGIAPDALHRLDGYVLTTRKDNPLVEQLIHADSPDDGGRTSTLLASWNYGLGKTVVFTSDAGKKWANAWTGAEYYDKFFTQMIRFSMRPVDKAGQFNVASTMKDGKVNVVLTALDENDEYLDSLEAAGKVIGPDMQAFSIDLQQIAPGRYVGEFDAARAGSYLINVVPGPGYELIKTGVNVPYSAEFRDRKTNFGLLETLAALPPKGGQPGKLIEGELNEVGFQELLEVNTFRHTLAKPHSSQPAWPLVMVIAGVVFFADVFVRRVAVQFGWLAASLAWAKDRIFRREAEAMPDERIERLRSKKAAISQQLAERRAGARFEPEAELMDVEPDTEIPDDVARQRPASEPPLQPPDSPRMTPDEAEEETYTDRLLQAKKKAFKKK